MACLIQSSYAYSVISPPHKCATGILNNSAAYTATNISYLSPKTMIISGFNSSYAFAKFINSLPHSVTICFGESKSRSILIILLILNPSFSIYLYVYPYFLFVCIPVTINCNSK